MEIVVVGTGPEGEEVSEGPGEIVTGVGIDGLEKTKGDPEVDCQDVEVLSEEAVEERSRNGALSEDEDFEGVGVFSGLAISTQRINVLRKTYKSDRLEEGRGQYSCMRLELLNSLHCRLFRQYDTSQHGLCYSLWCFLWMCLYSGPQWSARWAQ